MGTAGGSNEAENMELARTPTEEMLRRLLMQAERLINSRPMTEIPVDPEEEESLTPKHFLLGSSNGIKPGATLRMGAKADTAAVTRNDASILVTLGTGISSHGGGQVKVDEEDGSTSRRRRDLPVR